MNKTPHYYLNKGDRVKIVRGPEAKVGEVGTVEIVGINGAIIKLDQGMATAVKYINLEKIEDESSASV